MSDTQQTPAKAKKAAAAAAASTPQGQKGIGDTKLTERELEILSKAWNCMKNQPEIDMPKLAEKLGMTNVGSATNAWGRIKKKLFTDVPASSPAGGEGNPTPRKRKQAVKQEPAADGDSGSDGAAAAAAAPESPTKKVRKTPGRKKLPASRPAKVKPETAEDVKSEEAPGGDNSGVKYEDDDMAGEV